MNPNVLIAFILLMVGLVWFWFNNLKNRVKIIYTRETGQEVEFMVKITDRNIIFDKKRFRIVPNRARLSWKSVLGIVGTWMITYHFVWYSIYPENPKEFGVVTQSPSVRHAMNQEEKFLAYQRAERDRYDTKKKGLGGLTQWIPYIAILGVIIAIFLIYKQNSDMAVMKKALQDILTRGGK